MKTAYNTFRYLIKILLVNIEKMEGGITYFTIKKGVSLCVTSIIKKSTEKQTKLNALKSKIKIC